jgi:hypothetical protein
MLRGSRPGERRGGRERGTPNRRTILRERILALGLDHPTASQRTFLRNLGKDRKLPAEIRIAITATCCPPPRTRSLRSGGRSASVDRRFSIDLQTSPRASALRGWSPRALDTLLGVVQDTGANLQARSKAALRIAEFLLPKVAKKPKVPPDEYGFLISPELAGAYRDIQLELRALKRDSSRKIPAIEEKIKKLEARYDAMRRRLDIPYSATYGDKEAAKDLDRLIELYSLRGNGSALTEVQQVEEAHLWARYDGFYASPAASARRRRETLEEADRRFRRFRLEGQHPAPPLSRQQRKELKIRRRLYPAEPKQNPSPFERDVLETDRDHPFAHELPAPDGNFYPRHSKLYPRQHQLPPVGSRGYTVNAAEDRERLEELRTARVERTTLTPEEDAEAAQLAARVAAYERNPQPFDEARIRELEERRAGSPLAASEEAELRELRERYPEFAAIMDLMDLHYLYQRTRELEIARKAGLDFDAMCQQAEVVCLRFRDPSKYLHEWRREIICRSPHQRSPLGSRSASRRARTR